jgi:RecA/RadA recombinase
MAIDPQVLMELKIKVKNGIKINKDEKKLLKDNSDEEKAKRKGLSFGERMKLAAGSEYGQLMGDEEKDNYPIRDWISTGNYLLNAQISGYHDRGIPSGRVWMLAGIASCGKTFLMLETVKNAMEMGYFFVLYDTEMANNIKAELKKRGIKTEQMLFIPIDTVENLTKSVLNLLDDLAPTDKVIIGIDSIGNLSTTKELTDTMAGDETADMTRARKLKAFFRVVTIKAGIKNVPMIPINHVYQQIGGFGVSVVGGGSGGMYNASIINEFTKAQEKGKDGTGKEATTGGLITSTVTKCRTAKEKTKVKFTIDFEEGLTLYSGLFLFCEEHKLFEKVANSFKFTKKVGDIEIPSVKKGDTFTKAKMTPAFWEEFLAAYLAQYLTTTFRYQSVSEQVLGEDFFADDQEEMFPEPELLEE